MRKISALLSAALIGTVVLPANFSPPEANAARFSELMKTGSAGSPSDSFANQSMRRQRLFVRFAMPEEEVVLQPPLPDITHDCRKDVFVYV